MFAYAAQQRQASDALQVAEQLGVTVEGLGQEGIPTRMRRIDLDSVCGYSGEQQAGSWDATVPRRRLATPVGCSTALDAHPVRRLGSRPAGRSRPRVRHLRSRLPTSSSA